MQQCRQLVMQKDLVHCHLPLPRPAPRPPLLLPPLVLPRPELVPLALDVLAPLALLPLFFFACRRRYVKQMTWAFWVRLSMAMLCTASVAVAENHVYTLSVTRLPDVKASNSATVLAVSCCLCLTSSTCLHENSALAKTLKIKEAAPCATLLL